MSIRLMDAVWKGSPYKGGALLVLLSLADFANDEGVCWPSVPAIAVKSKLTERQTYTILRQFQRDGIISLVEHGGGRRANRYQLHFTPEVISPLKPFHPLKPTSGHPCSPLQGTPEICDIAIRKNRHRTVIEPSENGNKRSTHRFISPSIEEVAAYCKERGNSVKPQTFLDYYAASGWKRGNKTQIVDWKAAVRTWENNNHGNGKSPGNRAQQRQASNLAANEEAKRSFGLAD